MQDAALLADSGIPILSYVIRLFIAVAAFKAACYSENVIIRGLSFCYLIAIGLMLTAGGLLGSGYLPLILGILFLGGAARAWWWNRM